MNLNKLEATALASLAKKCADADKEKLAVGSYVVDTTIRIKANVVKADGTNVSPDFSLPTFVKIVLLEYAQELASDANDVQEGVDWINAIVGSESEMQKIVTKSTAYADMVAKVDAKIIAAWDIAEAEAKKAFQASAKKVPRSEATIVTGTIEKVPDAARS